MTLHRSKTQNDANRKSDHYFYKTSNFTEGDELWNMYYKDGEKIQVDTLDKFKDIAILHSSYKNSTNPGSVKEDVVLPGNFSRKSKQSSDNTILKEDLTGENTDEPIINTDEPDLFKCGYFTSLPFTGAINLQSAYDLKERWACSFPLDLDMFLSQLTNTSNGNKERKMMDKISTEFNKKTISIPFPGASSENVSAQVDTELNKIRLTLPAAFNGSDEPVIREYTIEPRYNAKACKVKVENGIVNLTINVKKGVVTKIEVE